MGDMTDRKINYKTSPENVLLAEESSRLKWAHRCALCVSRDEDGGCRDGRRWRKDTGCPMWRLDVDARLP